VLTYRGDERGVTTVAMYHLHVRFIKRTAGRSSVAAAAYRAGEKIKDERTGTLYDFTHKTHVTHQEVLLPEHLPERLQDRATLWNTVELGLRANGQPAFEVEFALPRELTGEQRTALARQFAKREFVDKGLAVDMCLHMGVASDGGPHPHCHLLVSTRRWKADGTMDKAATDLQDNPALIQKIYALEQAGKLDDALRVGQSTNLIGWRKQWAADQNAALEQYNHEDRVDHRTLKAQKIAREPIPNIGVGFYKGVDRLTGWLADRVGAFKELTQMRDLRRQFGRIQQTRKDLTAEFIAMAQEFAPELVKGFAPGEQRERGNEYER